MKGIMKQGKGCHMDRDSQVRTLLAGSYHIMDMLPAVVPENRYAVFSDIEEYFFAEKEVQNIADKFIRIVLKLLCYYPSNVYYKQWHQQLNAVTLAGMIKEIVVTQRGFLNILFEKENMLLQVDGGELHLTVYGGNDDVSHMLADLAQSEGLFWR